MTLTEAIALVREGTLDNVNLAAPKRLFDALELVLEAAQSVAEKEG